MQTIREKVNAIKDIIREPFTSTGCYEKVMVATDGGCICHQCVKKEFWNILDSTRKDYRDGWQFAGVFLAEEVDGPIYCDHCNRTITEEY